MEDLLVRLYDVKEDEKDRALEEKLRGEGVRFFHILPPDLRKAVAFARTFGDGWADECLTACANHPSTCIVAVKNREIIGFACYDATAKDYFGPTGVLESERGRGIGTVLLKKCLFALAAEGYAYAIIGGVGDAKAFYEKTVGAVGIPHSSPGLYGTMVSAS